MVENTRCPVSAALMAVSNVSRSRISPMRMMSGFWRSTALIANSKLGTSRPISRCWKTDLSSMKVYSMGSSMVTMCFSWLRLIQLSIAAMVELFPEPVAPQMRRMPSLALARFEQRLGLDAQLLKLGHAGLDVTEDDAHRTALVKRVDAEPADALGRVGKVHLAEVVPVFS